MRRMANHFPRAPVLPGMIAGILVACGGDGGSGDVEAGNTLVFQSRGAIQCESKGLTPEQGAQVLVNGGIDVIRSGCGAMTDILYPAVCGGGTADILLHEIRRENLPDAERLGFKSTATLKNSTTGAGYAWLDCETGARLP